MWFTDIKLFIYGEEWPSCPQNTKYWGDRSEVQVSKDRNEHKIFGDDCSCFWDIKWAWQFLHWAFSIQISVLRHCNGFKVSALNDCHTFITINWSLVRPNNDLSKTNKSRNNSDVSYFFLLDTFLFLGDKPKKKNPNIL